MARKEAKGNINSNLAEYLLSQPLLSSFLVKGLEYLGYEVDE